MNMKHIIQGLHNAGLKQKHICRLTGIEAYTISRWSTGEAPQAADNALKLLDLYNKATSGPRTLKSLLAKADAP
jgi:transcriptional regulator with XRE-family HTH domain